MPILIHFLNPIYLMQCVRQGYSRKYFVGLNQQLGPQMMASSAPWLHAKRGPLVCTSECVAPCFWLIPIFLILRLISWSSSSNCPAALVVSWERRGGQPCGIVLEAQ